MSWLPRRLRDPFALRRWSLVATAAIAVGALPVERFPPAWTVTFTLPALLLVAILRRTALRFEFAFGIAAVLQLVAIVGARAFAGTLEQLPSLGYTLVPPLTFLAIRDDDLDAPRALFLGFCLFLVGTILGGVDAPLLLAFVIAAVTTLQADAATASAEGRASWRGPRAQPLARIRVGASIVLAALVVALGAFQALRALPQPGAAKRLGSREARLRSGLSDGFTLEDQRGAPVELRSDELVVVRSADQRGLPRDLYLRVSHFDVAGLDNWQTLTPRRTRSTRPVWNVGDPQRDMPVRRIDIEVLQPARDLTFVPPGAVRIETGTPWIGDPDLAWFRWETIPEPEIRYSVDYQDLRGMQFDARMTNDDQLLQIPDELQPYRAVFTDLLRSTAARRAIEPMELANAIANELQARCTYDLRGPGGDHPHAILNFLAGDRRGYCRHFASATAIALRLGGVPCRLGVGLYGGDPSRGDPAALSLGSQHAHAWVELPFHDLGWVVFDPTPPAARADGQLWQLDDDATADRADDLAAAGATGGTTDRIGLLSRPWEAPWLWVLLGLAAIAPFVRRAPRNPADEPDGRVERARSRTARRVLDQILTRLEHTGHGRRGAECLEDYATRLIADGIGGTDLHNAFAAYQEVRFGGQPFDGARHRRMTTALAAAGDPPNYGS